MRQRTLEVIEMGVTEITGEHVNFSAQYPDQQFPDDGRAHTYVTLHFLFKKKGV